MTYEENQSLIKTVDLWNALVKLPDQHPDDIHEIRFHIHAIQHLIMSRPTQRVINAINPKI